MKRAVLASLIVLAACGSGPGRQTTRELEKIANDYARQEYQERQDVGASGAQAAAEPVQEHDRCGASSYSGRVGAQIAEIEAPEGARIIRPDTIVTHDYRPERLNILVDADGRVTQFACY